MGDIEQTEKLAKEYPAIWKFCVGVATGKVFPLEAMNDCIAIANEAKKQARAELIAEIREQLPKETDSTLGYGNKGFNDCLNQIHAILDRVEKGEK